MDKKVILTGLRANNELTVGNYFGAIKPLIDMAKTKTEDYRFHIFVPDLHSFTTPIDHSKLFGNVISNIRMYAALGLPLDHRDVLIYRQSFIPAHSELTWILDCFSGYGELLRMTQFKQRILDNDSAEQEHDDRITAGLFNYPVLMAADILLYDAKYIPVGEDQTQHLEFTRDLAIRFNNRFGEIFTVPEEVKKQHDFFQKGQALRIRDLLEPHKKMSKSYGSAGSIFLSEQPTEAYAKIMRATTDNVGSINFDPENQPGISNLLTLTSLMDERSIEDTIMEWQGKTSYGEFKRALAEKTKAFLTKVQSELNDIDDNQLLNKLSNDEQQLNETANKKLLKVQKAVGLRQ